MTRVKKNIHLNYILHSKTHFFYFVYFLHTTILNPQYLRKLKSVAGCGK